MLDFVKQNICPNVYPTNLKDITMYGTYIGFCMRHGPVYIDYVFESQLVISNLADGIQTTHCKLKTRISKGNNHIPQSDCMKLKIHPTLTLCYSTVRLNSHTLLGLHQLDIRLLHYI